MPDGELITGRFAPRGEIVEEHEIVYCGNPDPSYMKYGRLGIIAVCSCGTEHKLTPHTDEQLIRFKANHNGIS